MKLYIRAHDLGVKGEAAISNRLTELGLEGVQLVAYKCLDGVPYAPGAITAARAKQFAGVMQAAGKSVPLIGAYFNPVHSDKLKVARCVAVFEEYLSLAKDFGCDIVGSETGSFNDDKWTYHPQNRTNEAVQTVIKTFSHLCDVAAKYGVYVGMEGAFGHVCYDVDRLKYAIDCIGKPNIKIIFDLYNYLDISNVDNRYDILRHGLEVFGNRICVFHVKDCVIEDGKLKQCGVGKGIFDYGRILPMIAEYNPDAKLVLEGTVGDDIPFAVNYLKQKINNVRN